MSDRAVRVLLVDDDENDYVLTRHLLADVPGEGFALDWASSFNAGLEGIVRAVHDLYLIDIRLGCFSGIELMREAHARGCRGPFLILTGLGQRELELEAMQAGAADFLEKGLLTTALLERAIRFALRERRQAEELERRVEERTAELEQANQRLREEMAERARAEARLRRSRERLDLIVQSTELGLWYCDLPFDRLQWNFKCKEHFGLPPDADVTIDTFYERIHPDDRDGTRRAIERSLHRNELFDFVYRTVAPNGRQRWVRAIGKPFLDEAGKPTRFDGVTVDVTVQKTIEEQLADSQRFLSSVIDALPSHVAVLDETGVIISVNEAWRRWAKETDRPPQTLTVGESYLGACAPDRDMVDGIREVIAGTRDSHLAEYPSRSSGEEHWFQMRVTRFPGPGPVRVVVAHEDVTHRVESEQAIRRRSEQLQELARIAAHLNVANDLQAVMRLITEAARHIVGAHQAITTQAEGQNWAEAVNVVSLSARYASWQNDSVVPDGSGIDAIVCRDNRSMRLTQAELEAHPGWKGFGQEAGKHPPMRGWLAAPLVGRDGRNLGLIQLSDRCEGDFTEDDEAILVQLAQMTSVALENARLYHDLREADRLKDEFLAMLAHELRNPLAPIRTALYLVRMQEDRQDASVRDAYETMERQMEHLVRLVDDLLDVSRITRGKINLQKVRTPVTMVVARAVEASRPLIEQRGHVLEVRLPQEGLVVEGDPVRLAQVLLNLLNNAAKYTPARVRIQLIVQRAGDEVLLLVRDNGIGIPGPLLSHIFDPFMQGDRTPERTEGGLGIGLTLVKRLTEMHGGEVQAASAGRGQGSEFTVRLPLSTGPAVEMAASPPAPATPGHRRILVVDDNGDAARTLASVLRRLGHEVRTAADGPQGLAEATAFGPDVVLLDIGMPGMTGLEVARRLRATPELKQPLLVALTGFGGDDDRREAFEAGFDAHLVKPVDLRSLQVLLANGVA